MNSDEIAGLVRDVINSLLTSGAMAAYLNGQQAAAIAAGVAALVGTLYGVYTRWNTRKVAETAVVTSTAPTVAIAKAASIQAGK